MIGAVTTGCGGGNEDGRRGDVQALPRSACPTPIVYEGEGDPVYLIASDLPLQNPLLPQAAQMTKAIEFVLRQRRFTAGDKKIAYQSCDDSTAQAAAWDPSRCAANASSYAANAAVVGIIGTYDSGCARIAIPVLNAKSIAMVSPTNTYVGLTQGGVGAEVGEPGKYLPSGRRSYARVVGADNVQGPALATFAKADLKLTRIFVLTDGQRYGAGIAAGFASAARGLHLGIAGSRAWTPKARDYRTLANAIKQSGADGVMLAGIVDNHGGRLVKDLRAALGTGVAILAPDGFTPVESLVADAGGAAEGVYVSVAGTPADRLTGAGKAFVDGFGATVGGADKVAPESAYAAQAAVVLLDAIAASDGSRASVVERLFHTNATDGIVGPFGIDENGDTTRGTVTVSQITGGRRTTVTVVVPDPGLVPNG